MSKRAVLAWALLGVIAVYVVWVNLPRVHDAEEVARIVAFRNQEWELYNKTYKAPPGEIKKIVMAFNECNPIAAGRDPEELEKTLENAGKTRADLERARKQFGTLLPGLAKAVKHQPARHGAGARLRVFFASRGETRR